MGTESTAILYLSCTLTQGSHIRLHTHDRPQAATRNIVETKRDAGVE